MEKYFDLLKLARETIKAKLEGEELIVDDKIKKKYSKKQACFVTLTIGGELRGCIGSLVARQKLYLDVIENAKNAAFRDPRFNSVEKEELKKIKIEISIISVPKDINYKNSEDLKKKINGKGVIISNGFNQATYLPQVWEELHNFEEFISSLCRKAGLASDFWKSGKLKVQIYEVEKVEE